MHSYYGCFNIGIYFCVWTVKSNSRQVFSCPEAAGENDRIKIICTELAERFDLTPCNAGRFHQDVSVFRHLFMSIMVDYMILLNVRGKDLIRRSLLCDSQECQGSFMDLRAVENAATG